MSEVTGFSRIDIVSDVVCSMVLAGAKNASRKRFQDEVGPVVVRWRPYQLDPTIPEGGRLTAPSTWRKSRARAAGC